MAKRVRLSRSKGWRMPENTVSVARPTKWGNPFRLRTTYGLARVPAVHHVGRPWEYEGRISADGARHDFHHQDGRITRCDVRYMTAAECVEAFEAYVTGGGWPIDWVPRNGPTVEQVTAELAGKNLACWCPLDSPCHGDVLLRIASEGGGANG